MSSPDLTIDVIAFNEEECLVPVVREVISDLEAAGLSFEVVIVNDGSTDGTAREAEELMSMDGRVRELGHPLT